MGHTCLRRAQHDTARKSSIRPQAGFPARIRDLHIQ